MRDEKIPYTQTHTHTTVMMMMIIVSHDQALFSPSSLYNFIYFIFYYFF